MSIVTIMNKVIVFGTFDILHAGHLDFFRQAKKYGDYLVVVVARDKTIKKLKKRPPMFKEKQRLAEIRKVELADEVILGHLNKYYQAIINQKPKTICLGYDQVYFIKGLNKLFPEINIVKLKPYKPNIYKSSKFRKLIVRS